jgi:hypothetical protein
MKVQRNAAGGVCKRCKTYIAPQSGWKVPNGLGWNMFHNSCYNSKLEDDKNKLAAALKVVGKLKENGNG